MEKPVLGSRPDESAGPVKSETRREAGHEQRSGVNATTSSIRDLSARSRTRRPDAEAMPTEGDIRGRARRKRSGMG